MIILFNLNFKSTIAHWFFFYSFSGGLEAFQSFLVQNHEHEHGHQYTPYELNSPVVTTYTRSRRILNSSFCCCNQTDKTSSGPMSESECNEKGGTYEAEKTPPCEKACENWRKFKIKSVKKFKIKPVPGLKSSVPGITSRCMSVIGIDYT